MCEKSVEGVVQDIQTCLKKLKAKMHLRSGNKVVLLENLHDMLTSDQRLEIAERAKVTVAQRAAGKEHLSSSPSSSSLLSSSSSSSAAAAAAARPD